MRGVYITNKCRRSQSTNWVWVTSNHAGIKTALRRLRNEIYRTRSVLFDWGLTSVVEMNNRLRHRTASSINSSREIVQEPSSMKTPRYSYPLHTFSAVRVSTAQKSEASIFRVGEVLDFYWGRANSVCSLRIQCYSVANSKCVFTGRYESSKLHNSNVITSDWIDRAETESVLIHFQKWTMLKHLPINVLSQLRTTR